MRARLHRLLHDRATRLLTAPLGSYLRSSGQDIDRLKRHVRKGDVLLVCGDQRVSEVIRYLTQSSWSHSAIYVGDELLHRDPEQARALEARFGDDARHLIVEALIEEGVVVSPVSKYRGFHLRLCRPFGLRSADLARLMDEVFGQLGSQYDVTNLLDLARYFLPVSLVPARWRRDALELGSGRPTEVICSSMIARAFDAVGFPILPRTEEDTAGNGDAHGHARDGHRDVVAPAYHAGFDAPSWPSRRPLARHLRMSERPHTLITPRDFDLSPYFEIVKFSLIEGTRDAAPARHAAGPGAETGKVTPLWRRLARWPRADEPTMADAPVAERAAGG